MSVFLQAGKGVAKEALGNIRKMNVFDGRYIESAINGAAAMGAVGGVTEWAQGGSFGSGVVNGAMNGAMLGAGSKALRVGAGGSNWKNYGAKKTASHYSDGVSKQVKALQKHAATQKVAEATMSTGRRKTINRS